MEKYSAFAQSCIGESHIRRGLICQDFSLAENDKRFAFAAVADGHGSPVYLRTEKGSQFAAQCALECVVEFLESLDGAEEIFSSKKQRKQLFRQLWQNIVSNWQAGVDKDFCDNPFTEEELKRIPKNYVRYREHYLSGGYTEAYGTTLIFAVVTDNFAFGAQIGDGKCVVLKSDGSADEPIPDDPRCYDNVTTSMCQEDAASSARYFYYEKNDIPPAIFLCTDGIENSYSAPMHLHAFYRELALTAAEDGIDECVRKLADFLPEMTRMGSRDDLSCAGIVSPDALKQHFENSAKSK